jgi:hypothetical protein
MPIYDVQVTLNHDSALPEDSMVNTWHVSGDLGATPGLVAQEFIDFYFAAAPGALNTIAARLSSKLNGSGTVKLYNRADVKPRVPVVDVDFSGKTVGGTAMPSEVAACLSFKAAAGSGVNANRRRNRVYIGPLAEMARTSSTDPTVDSIFRSDLGKALQALKDGIEAVTTDLATLVGFSPTDGVPWTIAECWVDNAFDTQRRRGEEATARTVTAIS